MATVFIPVEISDGALAELVGARIAENPPAAAGAASSAASPAQGADPWTGASGGAPAGPAQSAAPAASPAANNAPPATSPNCAHGAMRYVPGGFSRSTGKAYQAFWACPTPRGATDKCKSVSA